MSTYVPTAHLKPFGDAWPDLWRRIDWARAPRRRPPHVAGTALSCLAWTLALPLDRAEVMPGTAQVGAEMVVADSDQCQDRAGSGAGDQKSRSAERAVTKAV